MAPAITQRAAYQLSRKMVPVSIGGALEITDPLLKIAGTKGRGTALAFTAMVIRRAPEKVKKKKKYKALTGIVTHVLNNSWVTFSGDKRELLFLLLSICLNGEYSPSFHTSKAHGNVSSPFI